MRPNTTTGAAVALIAFAAQARAGALCVNPKAPGCKSTIQAAVDAANPGDLVRIAAGTYFEDVVIPAGKDGIKLIGAGKLATVIDAGPLGPDVVHDGSAFAIASPGVQISNLGVVHDVGKAVAITASGVVVQGVRVDGKPGFNVNLPGLNVSDGFDVVETAESVQLVGNEIHGSDVAIFARGPKVLIKNNLIDGYSSGAITVGAADVPPNGQATQADGAQIVGNRILGGLSGGLFGAFGIGLNFAGTPTISGNEIEASDGPIDGAMSNPTIEHNRLIRGGIRIMCEPCTGGSVSFNTIVSAGIVVETDGPGLHVDANVISRGGVSLDGTGIVAAHNRVTDAHGRCFATFGSANTLSDNTASGCSDAGFYFNGDDDIVERNTALNVFENGFTVDGDNGGDPAHTGTTLTQNKASFALGQGFAVINGADTTQLNANAGNGSRVDFCDDGVGTGLSANRFGTTAATPQTDCVVTHEEHFLPI